jgi:hypothetical protein
MVLVPQGAAAHRSRAATCATSGGWPTSSGGLLLPAPLLDASLVYVAVLGGLHEGRILPANDAVGEHGHHREGLHCAVTVHALARHLQ